MKFSESWLRSFVDPACSGEAFSHLLTMAGLEVEEEETVAPRFTEVVVAQVLSVDKHPDADRLNVCRSISVPEEPLQIVCGAPNVAAGLKVPCALPAPNCPAVSRIKVAKVRGVESSGMLCSAKELGIAEDASGLLLLAADAPVGRASASHLDLDDRLLTLKLTPNRADCLSLEGVAREVAALTGTPARFTEVAEVPGHAATDARRRARRPGGLPALLRSHRQWRRCQAATPEWMRRRLERSGLRPISALVDITNYVMLELGQPLHAFDNSRLSRRHPRPHGAGGRDDQLLNEQTLIPAARRAADQPTTTSAGDGRHHGRRRERHHARHHRGVPRIGLLSHRGDCRACAALWLRFGRLASFRARRRFRRHAARARACHAAGHRDLRRPGGAGQVEARRACRRGSRCACARHASPRCSGCR
jgi:phenylalanyl-tRNA synthetase beta chain